LARVLPGVLRSLGQLFAYCYRVIKPAELIRQMAPSVHEQHAHIWKPVKDTGADQSAADNHCLQWIADHILQIPVPQPCIRAVVVWMKHDHEPKPIKRSPERLENRFVGS